MSVSLFPTLSALSEDYDVYVVVDASGTFNKFVRGAALNRMMQAGAILINWFAVASELQRNWRKDTAGFSKLLSDHLVSYSNLITSYNK